MIPEDITFLEETELVQNIYGIITPNSFHFNNNLEYPKGSQHIILDRRNVIVQLESAFRVKSPNPRIS